MRKPTYLEACKVLEEDRKAAERVLDFHCRMCKLPHSLSPRCQQGCLNLLPFLLHRVVVSLLCLSHAAIPLARISNSVAHHCPPCPSLHHAQDSAQVAEVHAVSFHIDGVLSAAAAAPACEGTPQHGRAGKGLQAANTNAQVAERGLRVGASGFLRGTMPHSGRIGNTRATHVGSNQRTGLRSIKTFPSVRSHLSIGSLHTQT